jgi:hypothetical protein
MHSRRLRASVSVSLASLLVAAAACTSGDDSSPPATPTPDAGLTCTGVACVDAHIPDTGSGFVDAANDASDSALPDASEASATDTGTPDGGVIVGCVPQEVSTRYDATWIFGAGCRADWDKSNAVTFSTSAFDGGVLHFAGFEGTISAADAFTGALFAVSDGIDVYDGQGNKTNTAPLGGNSSASQAVAFLGKPGSASDFYIVANAASSGSGGNAGLYWSELPCGQLVPAAAPALIAGTEQFTEALVTVRNANNVDRWLLSSAAAGIAVIPVTASGFGAATTTPWTADFTGVTALQRSFISFARDRHTFAITAEGVGTEIGQFDNATGAISGLTKVPLPVIGDLYSAAFSPDGSKLYVSSWSGQYYQVDLAMLAVGIDAGLADGGDAGTAVTLLGSSGGALRLAIDDKLYVAMDGQASLGVVSNPNAPAAQLQITTAALPTGCTSSYGFPGIGDL